MMTIKKEFWLVKVYEFLTGLHDLDDKPKSFCGLARTILITIILSPVLAIYGSLGLISNDVKNLKLGKRIGNSIGFGVAYIVITVLSIGLINDILGNEKITTTLDMLGNWVYFIAFGSAILLLLGFAILGLSILIFTETKDWIVTTYETRKYKKIKKARERGVKVDMSKADWVGTVKNKICPRIKWE